MRFALYTLPDCPQMTGITFDDLIKLAIDKHDIFARAEDSGCEGCYCEVARWNEKANEWQRYAFEKFFGGEHPSEQDEARVTALGTAKIYANAINEASRWAECPIIHRLPTWGTLGYTPQANNLFQALADLVEWEASLGGFDAPAWGRAKRLLEAIREGKDAA